MSRRVVPFPAQRHADPERIAWARMLTAADRLDGANADPLDYLRAYNHWAQLAKEKWEGIENGNG